MRTTLLGVRATLGGTGLEGEQKEVLSVATGLSPECRLVPGSRYYPGNSSDDLRTELGLRPGTPLVCCIAEFAPNKNHGVLLEGMAAGVPVVASAVRGNVDLVRPGINGWLVNPRKPLECADTIMDCLANPDESRRLGFNGRRVVEPYSLGSVREELRSIYQWSLCQSSG